MTEEARTFAIEIDREWAAMQDDLREAVGTIMLEAARRVVLKSPRDTGRFASNWFTTIGGYTDATRDIEDLSGQASLSNAADVIGGYAAQEGWPRIVVQNNLPYAVPLEEGHSQQAPLGVVGVTVAELQTAFDGSRV